MEFKCAPVLLINFNRPDFTERQIANLRGVKPSRVFFAVDGPRADRSGEVEAVEKVRKLAKTIDWSCDVETLFQGKNLGCKYGVSGAITWFFEKEEMGIVLEDDCLPTLDFFQFASEMLERYKDDDRIGAINGFNFFNLQSDRKASYHFSQHMDIWGWASWRRVWREYDVEMSSFKDRIPEIIENADMTSYYKKVLRGFVSELDRGFSTWDVQFAMLSLSKGWLNVVPRYRLVSNVGLADVQATHTGGWVYWGKEWAKVGTLDFPLVHPKEIVCDKSADLLRERLEGAIFPRGLTWLGAKFSRLSGILECVGTAVERVAPSLFGWHRIKQPAE